MVAPTLDREPIAAARAEREALEAIEEIAQSDGAMLVEPGTGRQVVLPKAARAVLLAAIHALRRGSRVSLIPVGASLTTQQAAELLNVSRPYLIRILEAGDLPYEMVGTHRRLDLDDVLRYRAHRTQRRRDALRRLSQEADELGIYTE